MKYASLLFTGCALLFAVTGNAQAKKKPVAKKPAASQNKTAAKPAAAGFTKGPDNLEYKVISRGKGLVTPQIGDMMQLHIKQKIDDSLMLNTMATNKGNPIDVTMQQSMIKGDLMGGLALLKEGDSAVFRIRLDTLAARAKQPRPEWTDANAHVIWEVKLVKIKDKAQIQAEQAKMQAEAAAKAKEQVATDDKLIQEYLKEKGITNAKKTESGLYYVIHKEGTGPKPAAGQKVAVNYTGFNTKGEKFDSSVDSAFHHVTPIEFPLGQRNVIAGWDEGIALLNKGGKATLYIPSGLAYGATARSPQIPANAILIFDVELVDIKE
jgi:FKBP-type peptidyl-prolyl cis-trans isomerase